MALAGYLSALPQTHARPTARHLSRALELDGRSRVLDAVDLVGAHADPPRDVVAPSRLSQS